MIRYLIGQSPPPSNNECGYKECCGATMPIDNDMHCTMTLMGDDEETRSVVQKLNRRKVQLYRLNR